MTTNSLVRDLTFAAREGTGMEASSSEIQPRRTPICIIVENLPVPADRRVWQEARALTAAGYQVSIICPKGRGFERSRETLDGIEIYRHSALEASRKSGYLFEYSWALAAEFFLALRVYAATRFRILQACNPPDAIFLIAAFFKLLGVTFIFDHHDPTPELYAAKFAPKGFLYRLTCWAERLTFRLADVSISTNDSLREIALRRGGVSPDRSFVVRSCPDLKSFPPQAPRPELKQGRPYLVVYVGVMGQQDGIELLLDSIRYLVKEKGRGDVLFALIGSGTELPLARARAKELGLDSHVTFTGALYGEPLLEYLATADVGVAPDPYNELNNKLTMTKLFEYMAFELPIVTFDLAEARRAAADAALYARANDIGDFAARIDELLNSPALRRQLGAIGRARVEGGLNWGSQKEMLVRAYRTALNEHLPPAAEPRRKSQHA